LQKIKRNSVKKSNPSAKKSPSPKKKRFPTQPCYILYGTSSSKKRTPSAGSFAQGNIQVRFEQDQYNMFKHIPQTASAKSKRTGESPDAKGHCLLESASDDPCNLNIMPERCSSQKIFKSRT
jgi:hypothetical protein